MKYPFKGPDSEIVNICSRMPLRNTNVYTTIDINKGVTQTVSILADF